MVGVLEGRGLWWQCEWVGFGSGGGDTREGCGSRENECGSGEVG